MGDETRRRGGRTDPIRVVIAEDDALLRGCLGELLGQEPDIEVVGAAADGEEAVRLVRWLRPDLLLLDLGLPVLDGVQVARAVCATVPETRIVVVTAHATAHNVRALIEVGVGGFLAKGRVASFGEFVAGLRAVHAGEVCLQPAVVRCLASSSGSPGVTGPTERDLDVLRLAAAG